MTTVFALVLLAQIPQALPNGYALPNGWKITPLGKPIPTEDLLLNLSLAPDGKALVATHGGFNPHGLVVVDPKTEEAVQRIPLPSAWLGLAWSSDGKRLFASGGNAAGRRNDAAAPVYVFDYANGKLSDKPVAQWKDGAPANKTYWSGMAHHPSRPILYAANRGNDPLAGYIAIFDSATGKLEGKITVEQSPYDVLLTPDGATMYVSNWSSDSISIIDTASRKVVGRIACGDNPNDLELGADGRLYVSNGNLNTVSVIDTKKRMVIETINVALTPNAPPGATPNALALDRSANMLFVANADNNAVAVVNVATPTRSEVLGFMPAGWYPSALAIVPGKLAVGNAKGLGGYSDERGPHSPLALDGKKEGLGSVKSLQKGSIHLVGVKNLKNEIRAWTRQVYENVPYNDSQLTRARAPKEPSIVPSEVGVGSPIKHVIYVIKENRTYDQVLGDLKKGNGDPRLTIFGWDVTPNHHAIAENWVLFDNLYCDGEVSVDGHSWSNSAIATDFNEKLWPANYGGHSAGNRAAAYVPSAGHMWDLAARAGLTYRSYGEYASRASDGSTMEAAQGVTGLLGHVAPKFKLPGMRDTDNVRAFFAEFEEYEKNFDSPDPAKRLPNFIVMSLGENHTQGTRPGVPTPRAMNANADHAVGMLVERVSKSKYWPQTAMFFIEDDAQDGPDHVDARRTVGLVVSPYAKRGIVDSNLYTTSSMLRTMELLLGLPPMTQYDAAALPMYAAFGTSPDLRPYVALAPRIDVNEKNGVSAWGAQRSLEMNLDEVDQAPMAEFNEIIWKSVKGADSPMPAPVHRFRFPSKPVADR
ncbi:MAG: alkaline phosphatase family protein [Bryobacteraceae bacterium]|nr:alkaline phosphatase family protein [Bryobacteraceae bacterium]